MRDKITLICTKCGRRYEAALTDRVLGKCEYCRSGKKAIKGPKRQNFDRCRASTDFLRVNAKLINTAEIARARGFSYGNYMIAKMNWL